MKHLLKRIISSLGDHHDERSDGLHGGGHHGAGQHRSGHHDSGHHGGYRDDYRPPVHDGRTRGPDRDPVAAPAQTPSCRNCGAINASQAKFCWSCGEGMTAALAACRECGGALVPGARFCSNCRAAVGR
jgi:RNA polymerase subunit RPABC4/transcription elongation factor Spt4